MKKIIVWLMIMVFMVAACGCQTEADKVAYNISKQADNFNCITGDTLFVMEGKMSVTDGGNVLRIYVEDDDGTYKKHMVGLSDNVTYTLEDLTANEVSKYHYTINFNPKMWIPFDFGDID